MLGEDECSDPEGGGGTVGPDPPPPLKNHKNIGLLSNTGLNKKCHKNMTNAPKGIGQA